MSSIHETLGSAQPSEFSSSFLSQKPGLVDLTLYPDGVPLETEDSRSSRVLEMGPVLFLGKSPDEKGEQVGHFAFPEAPSMTEFTVGADISASVTPISHESREYEMIFHSQGVQSSSINQERSPKPFSMGSVLLEGIIMTDHGGQEVVVAYPERPDEPFSMPTEFVTFSPAQKGLNGSNS